MQAMIKKWIKDNALNEEDPPCWRQLLGAVAAPHGGENLTLAQDLAKEHGGGSGGTGKTESTLVAFRFPIS